MFLVGKIVGTFGNKGDVKILSLIEPSDYIPLFKFVYIEDDSGQKQKLNVLTCKKHKNVFVTSLEGIDNMNVAESLKDFSVYVPSLELKELQENEFYYHQLEGLKVFSQDGDEIGVVDHITKGAGDILVIKDKNDKEIMIPFIEKIVPEVNLEEKTITVNLIDGLIAND